MITTNTNSSEGSEDNPAKAQDIGLVVDAGILQRLLRINVVSSLAAKAVQHDHDDRDENPRVAFVYVHEIVSNEARNKTANRDDDDADDERKRAGVDRCQRLSAKDDGRHGESKPGQKSVGVRWLSDRQ